MKILLAVDCYPKQINGVNNSVNILCQELISLGNDVRILALSDNKQSEFYNNNYYLGSIGTSLIYPGSRITLFNDNKFYQEIMDWHPDIIHTQTEFSIFRIALKIALHLKVPLIHTLHTMYEDYYHYVINSKKIAVMLIKRMEKIFFKRINYVIVPSNKVKNKLLELGYFSKVKVIPSGIDLEMFNKRISLTEKEKLFKKFQIEKDELVLISVSRIGKEKNIEELINMMEILVKDKVKIKLLIVGDGPDRNNLERLIKEKKLQSKVIFTGMIRHDEIYKYYQLGNIFISASTSETQGLTYNEAMASGLPLVCRDDECLQEIIDDGINGFKYKNIREGKEIISKFVNNKKMIKEMGSNSKKMVLKFDKKLFGKNILDFYQDVIKDYKVNSND